MADSLNTPTLPKLHPGLSRRALMREMAAAGMLAAVPIVGTPTIRAAQAAKPTIDGLPLSPAPVPSPRVRMNLLIEELFAVAREFNPHIAKWTVIVSEPRDGGSPCSVLIAGFDAPEPTSGKVEIEWRQA